jgi:hypothetical protein
MDFDHDHHREHEDEIRDIAPLDASVQALAALKPTPQAPPAPDPTPTPDPTPAPDPAPPVDPAV